MKEFKFTKLLFILAIIILIAWGAGVIFKAVAWVLNGLVGLAAIILCIGLISMYIDSKKRTED